MHAAGPHASPIRPATCIVTVLYLQNCYLYRSLVKVIDNACRKDAYVEILMGNYEQLLS